ncbi:hypothetical protein [Novosphingobium sp. BL-52-GroH]|uniref:hypothetical protein n=1 Tax=Novosphingobium sp. BL-52-GroH TaxID=3349877 RepID=UPI00384A7C68
MSDPLQSYEKFDGIGPHAETIETRASIGERFLECYASALEDPLLKGFAPADCPSEIVFDLVERLRLANDVIETAKRLSDNIAEFGTITDGEFVEGLDAALDTYRAGRSPASPQEVMMAETIHPAPEGFSAEQLQQDPILRYFHFAHLPASLQVTSIKFYELACYMIAVLPRNAERSVALRKLLEAKDAAVRANVQ